MKNFFDQEDDTGCRLPFVILGNMEVVLMEQNRYEKKSVHTLILSFSLPAIVSLIVEIMASVVDTAYSAKDLYSIPNADRRDHTGCADDSCVF